MTRRDWENPFSFFPSSSDATWRTVRQGSSVLPPTRRKLSATFGPTTPSHFGLHSTPMSVTGILPKKAPPESVKTNDSKPDKSFSLWNERCSPDVSLSSVVRTYNGGVSVCIYVNDIPSFYPSSFWSLVIPLSISSSHPSSRFLL